MIGGEGAVLLFSHVEISCGTHTVIEHLVMKTVGCKDYPQVVPSKGLSTV
jgi:hypothetical protein